MYDVRVCITTHWWICTYTLHSTQSLHLNINRWRTHCCGFPQHMTMYRVDIHASDRKKAILVYAYTNCCTMWNCDSVNCLERLRTFPNNTTELNWIVVVLEMGFEYSSTRFNFGIVNGKCNLLFVTLAFLWRLPRDDDGDVADVVERSTVVEARWRVHQHRESRRWRLSISGSENSCYTNTDAMCVCLVVEGSAAY